MTMNDDDEYPDPNINLLMHGRADRGRARGADAVFDAARSHASRPAPGRRLLALTAAVIAGLVIVAGIVFAFPERGSDDSQLVIASADVQYEVCNRDPEPVGGLADDPAALLCGLAPGEAPTLTDYAGPFVVGDVAAVVVPGPGPGTWVAEVAPRPNLDGPVPEPPDGAGGGALLRSRDPVRFDDGELVIETELVVGLDEYRGDDQHAWYELVLTTAGAPTWARTDGLFAKDQFAGEFTLGCRIGMSGNTTCSLMNDSTRGESNGGEIWQTSFVDDAGDEPSVGGFERPAEDLVFTTCGSADAATACADAIAIEFTATTVTIRLNGEVYFEQRGLPQLPAELVASDLYLYTAVMTSRSPAKLLRFHGVSS